MNNSTNIRIAKKYHNVIEEVWSEQSTGDGYWASLKECCLCEDTGCHFVHEWTVKDFLKSLQSITIMSQDEYNNIFGNDNLDVYMQDLSTMSKQDYKNFN